MKAIQPTISPWALRFFVRYARRYVARHFHAVRLSGKAGILPDASARPSVQAGSLTCAAPAPLVIYLNHSSWWDPLVAMLLADRCFPGRPSFAPMDAAQLQRYRIFRKLGVFGVEAGTARGARDFLRVSEAVLMQPSAILWLTPQARFADVRERPLRFAPGLASLARRFPHAHFMPLALEYAPWGERLPGVFARGGEMQRGHALRERFASATQLTAHFEDALSRTLDALAVDVISRDGTRFETLCAGARGVSAIYDFWRRIEAALRGREFRPEHLPVSAM